MGELIPSTVFDTEFFQRKDRLEIYRESMGIFFITDNYSQSPNNFKAKIKSYLIGDLMLIDCQTSAQSFVRTAPQIAKDGHDHFLIQTFLDGRTINSKDPNLSCDDQSLLVFDATRPWDAFNPDFRNLTLVIPRRLIGPKLKNEHGQHGKIMHSSLNPFAQILRTHILSLHETAQRMNAEFSHSLVQPTVDLCVAAMNFREGSKNEEAPVSENYATKFGIKQFIEQNLHDPKLNVEIIQAAFNLKRTTLYRIFPTGEGGIMSYVRSRRLQRAYRRLATSVYLNETVSQVSYEFGFENVSSFTRAFKSYFGELPSEVAKHRSPPKISPESPGRTWETWFRIL